MKKLTILAVFALMLGMMVLPSAVFAVERGIGESCAAAGDTCVAGSSCNAAKVCVLLTDNERDTYGLDTLGDPTKGVKLGNQGFQETVAKLINVVLSLLGIVAIVIVLVGGFKWMTAGGNDEKTAEARKWIFSGIIGLAIILSAWAITIFVFKQLYIATGGTGTGTIIETPL